MGGFDVCAFLIDRSYFTHTLELHNLIDRHSRKVLCLDEAEHGREHLL